MIYRIFTTDPNFIASRQELPRGAKIAYLVEYSLIPPQGLDKEKVEEWIAITRGQYIKDKLGLKEFQKYSTREGDAREFPNQGQAYLLREFIQRFQSEPQARDWNIEGIDNRTG